MDQDDGERIADLERIATIPSNHFRFLAKPVVTDVRSIRRGLIHFAGFWSGPWRVAFPKLTDVLAVADPEGTLEFVIVDCDQINEIHGLPEFAGNIHGNGETAWICNGHVVALSGPGARFDLYERHARELMDTCGA